MEKVDLKNFKPIAQDLAAAARLTPAGDLIKRAIYAKYRQAPDPMESMQDIPGAIRAVSYGAMPQIPITAGVLSGAARSIQGGADHNDVIQSSVEGGRNAALFASLFPFIKNINAKQLRNIPVPKGTMDRFKDQTLIENALTRISAR